MNRITRIILVILITLFCINEAHATDWTGEEIAKEIAFQGFNYRHFKESDTMSKRLDDHFIIYKGPLAVVRKCKYCDHTERINCGVPGVGRGYGMREGNKARGRMIQHIKKYHADKI